VCSYLSKLKEITLIDDPCVTLFNETFNENEQNLIENEVNLMEKFYKILKESVRRRVQSIPDRCKSCSLSSQSIVKFTDNNKCEHAKVAILFSGGIDSAVLASLVDECLLDKNEPIDLLNIAFENLNKNKKEGVNEKFQVPDRISGLETLKELNPLRKWNFVHVNVTLDELKQVYLFQIYSRFNIF
jgi:asparagine synthetase B (glutamine-hydrolysing)